MKLIYLFLFYNLLSFSQDNVNQKKIDSLLILVNLTQKDTVKVNLYDKICEEYKYNNIEKVDYYNSKILELSKKSNYGLGIGFYYFYKSNSINYDNAIEKIKYAEKASEIFFKLNNKKNYVRANFKIAYGELILNNLEKSNKVINKTLKIALKNNYSELVGMLYTLKGNINYQNGKLNLALINYNKALSFYNNNKNNEYNLQMLYQGIEYVNTDLGNYELSLYFLEKANPKSDIVCFNLESAFVASKMKKYENALKILNLNKKLKMTNNEKNYNNFLIGDTFFKLQKYKEAIDVINSVLRIEVDKDIQLNSYNILSECYLKTNNIKKAIELNEKAKQIFRFSKTPESIQSYYLNKIKISEAIGDYRTALADHKIYADLKEQQYINLNKDKIDELLISFESTKKDKKIKDLNFASFQKNQKIKEQNNYLKFSSILISLFLIGFFIFKKQYNTIKTKNTLIEINNTALENAKHQIEKSLIIKETLLKEVHHRVKNNLQLVSSLLYLQSKEKNISLEKFIDISQTRITAMSLIHENLYQTNDMSKVDFKEYANSLCQSILASYNNLQKDIQIKIEIENVYIEIQKAISLGLIINELISNAYKHAFKSGQKGLITLKLLQNQNNYELQVIDNGNGFEIKKSHKKSLGLELVSQLVHQINGVLQVKNNFGMQFDVQFQI